MEKQTEFNLWYLVIALFAVLMLNSLLFSGPQVEPMPYSQFLQLLEDRKVEKVVITEQFITGEYRDPTGESKHFVTTRVEPELADRLAQYGVEFSRTPENTFLRELLAWFIPLFVFFALWMLFFRKVAERQGGFMSIGKSRAKVYVEKDTGVTFDDVAGVDEAKQELREIVDFLKNPQEYTRLGAHIPKGVLLVGPPGTGKTLLARAVAGEAKVPFFSISGSEFVEMFVGVGAARVRDLFEQARQRAPAIIFIDELDALGKARGVGAVSNEEREQTLNQLLVEMDGFDPSVGLIIIAATNRPEILDPALLRAGRFDRQVLVDKPDKAGRAAILRVHLRKVKVADDVDVDKLAALTTGFSGADLANLVNEAALLAARRRADAVTMEDFTRAVERIVAGLEKKNRVLSEEERRVVAHHEMGHALVAMALPHTDPVHKVSIIPRGVGALGYTIQRPTEDRYLMTREELEEKMAVLLGGRTAEILVFGHLSTGAADDLAKATDIARHMVTTYGMDEDLGFVTYEQPRQSFLGEAAAGPAPRQYSEATAKQIDEAVKRAVERAYRCARAILEANREVLERSAAELLKKETLEEDDLRRLTEGLRRFEGCGEGGDSQA